MMVSMQASGMGATVKNFGGVEISQDDLEDYKGVTEASLADFLIKKDRENYEKRNISLHTESKKRGREDISGGLDDDQPGAKRRRNDGFLDCGSLSWTMLLGAYILECHYGSGPSDGEVAYCSDLQSIQEMVEVLYDEFQSMVPLVNNRGLLMALEGGQEVLAQFRTYDFLQIEDDTLAKDKWKFKLTQKGKKRGHNLCHGAGLFIRVEGNALAPEHRRIEITMFDKNHMEIIDDYFPVDVMS